MRINKFKRRRSVWSRLKFWQKEKPKPRYWGLKWLLGLGFLSVGFLFVYGTFFLPSVKDAEQLNFAESTIIYDRGALEPGAKAEEHILYVIHGDENRDYIPLEEISPWIPKATLAIEDDQFYSHFGFDAPALIKVFLHEVFGIGSKRGGSTITQQLAKQVFLSSERSYTRKFKELLLSIKLEWNYSKDEILELYLNKIPYGNNAFGIEAAARTYFGKSARDLTIAESSILASIPAAPTRFSPYGSNRDLLMGFYQYENYSTEAEARAAEEEAAPAEIEAEVETETPAPATTDETEKEAVDPNAGKLKVYKKGRKDLVLQRLLDLDMVSADQFYQAWGEANNLEFKRGATDIGAPHFVFYVREQVEAKYGQEFLSQGGLQIYTTLDPAIQAQAESTIEIKTAGYANVYGAENVAMTSINPDNGEILAYVGGKDWFNAERDGQVDVLTSRRQPGSSFKPLVYAAAFMAGYSPATIAFDVKTDFGGGYSPNNFDEKFSGPVSLRSALDRSLNIPAIKMAALAGADKVLQLTAKLGIPYEGDADTHGVAIGIGVAEIEPLAHIASFQAFAGDGSFYNPVAILEIRNAAGEILEKVDHEDYKQEGLDAQIAAMVRNILTDETARPTTGKGDEAFDWNTFLELEPEFNAGSKTGTSNRVIKNPEFVSAEPESNDNRRFLTVPGDSWTIGFTPHLVTGVWVGNNRGKPMKSGATGLTVAAPVWKNFMDGAHKILVENGADPEKAYNEPTPLVEVEINRLTGARVTEKTPEHLRVKEVYPSYSLPTNFDEEIGQANINIFTGEVADESTPKFAIRTINQLPLKSLKSSANWQEPVQKWIARHPIFMNSLGAQMDVEKKEIVEDPENPLFVANEADWQIPIQFLADLPPSLQRRWRQIENQAKLRGEAPDWNQLTGRDRNQDPSGPIGSDFSFEITSPSGTVTPGEIAVQVSYSSRMKLDNVAYYWDDELIYKSVKAPFIGKFTVPSNVSLGSSHLISAVATAENLDSAEDSVRVRVQPDTAVGPEVIFLGPLANQKISINSEAQVVADIIDFQSDVKTVEFFLDGQSLGSSTNPPYVQNFKTPEKMGRHILMIKAEDLHGNKTEKSIPITVSREGLNEEDAPNISSVDKNFRTLSLMLTFPEPDQITQAQIIISQPEKVLHQETWTDVNKFKYLFVPSNNFRGNASIELYIKPVGKTEFEKVDTRAIRF